MGVNCVTEINMLSNEEKFLKWLSSILSPLKVNDYYIACKEIEEFCLKKKIIKGPLLETTDINIVLKVKEIVERSKVFKFYHKKNKNELISAIGFFYRYTKTQNDSLINTKEELELEILSKDTSTETLESDGLTENNKNLSQIASIKVNATNKEYTGSTGSNEIVRGDRTFYENKNNFDTKEGIHSRQHRYIKNIEGLNEVDFRNLDSYIYTKPIKYTFFEEVFSDFVSWAGMYVSFINLLLDDYDYIIEKLKGKSISSKNGRIDIRDKYDKRNMTSPKLLTNGMYLETNLSAKNITKKIKCILDLCRIDYENIIIYYENNNIISFDTPEDIHNRQLQSIKNIEGLKEVDFRNPGTYAYTKPIKYMYFEEVFSDFDSWKGMYVNFINVLLEDYDSVIEKIKGKSISSKNGRVDIGGIYDKKGMAAPKILSNGMYIETNLSAKDITNKIKCFLDLCRIDYKNLIIYYIENDSTNKRYKRVEQDYRKNQTKDYKEKNKWLKNEKRLTETNYNVINDWTRDKKNSKNLKLYHNILAENFQKGFRFGSRIDMRKFRAYWEEKYDEKLDINDEVVYDNIDEITMSYQKGNQRFALIPETLLSEGTKRALFSYINDSFSDGKQAIYYKALYEEMQTVLCESGINNPEILKTYLSHVNEGQYYVERSYLTQEIGIKIDPIEEIRNYLNQIRIPVKVDYLCEELSHIPRKNVESTLYMNSEFIRNAKGEYFHADSVEITEDEIEGISNTINQEIVDNYFVSGDELIEIVKIKFPQVLERQPQFSKLGMRDAIGYKLKDRYSFKGEIISEKGKSLSMSDIYARYCKSKRSFTLNNLKALKKTLNSGVIYFEAVYDNALRISKNEFVSKNLAKFDIKGTDEAVDRFCKRDYIAIKDIGHFGSLPDAGFPWNSYLLEHYIADYSQKYKLIHTNFNENSCVGAIVKRTADIEDFFALVVDVIANSEIMLNIDDTLNYLCDRGFIARRSYKDIEQAIVQAKVIREKRG